MKLGVIGTGRIGSFHARTLATHPAVAAVRVYDPDRARAAAAARAAGAEPVASLDALLEGVDAAVIAAATAEHAALIRRVVAAGLPAFCEKPIALDLAATRDVVEFVAGHGAVVQMGFQRRFDQGYRRARAAVEDGRLGRLYLARLAGHDPHPPHETYVPTSGGIFRDLHIHDFDALRFVTGDEVVEVYADGAVLGFDWFAKYGDVDTAVAVLRLAGGAFAIVSGTRHDPLGYDIRMELFGAGDSVAVGLDARTPLRSLEDGGPAAPTHAYEGFLDRFAPAYRAELEAFLEVAAGRAPNPCPPEDALAAMLVAVACDRARAEHRPVRVEAA